MTFSESDNTLPIEVTTVDQFTIIKPTGDVDMSRSPQLRAVLAQVQHPASTRRIIINLDEVPYMDSSGVATLVEAMQIARRNGGKIILCYLNQRVLSIIEIARLDTIFNIYPTLEDALRS